MKGEKMLKTILYLSSSKDTMEDQDEKLGLSDEAMSNFVYTMCEVEFDVEVDEFGNAYATHLNGVKLERPVRI